MEPTRSGLSRGGPQTGKLLKSRSRALMVMKRGDVVEAGPADQIFAAPQTDYTRELLSAALGEKP